MIDFDSLCAGRLTIVACLSVRAEVCKFAVDLPDSRLRENAPRTTRAVELINVELSGNCVVFESRCGNDVAQLIRCVSYCKHCSRKST